MDSIVYKDEEVKYLQARVSDLEERLVSSSEGHMRDKAVLRAEIDRLFTQVVAANDSIERSKDYESELRAEVERLTALHRAASLHRDHIAAREQDLTAENTRLREALEKIASGMWVVDKDFARPALSQERGDEDWPKDICGSAALSQEKK
jgi:predicted  nucleic acid-binding Zn-ribbon protein